MTRGLAQTQYFETPNQREGGGVGCGVSMSERNTSASAVPYSVVPFIAARLSNWGYHGPCVDPWSFRKSKQTNQEFWLAASNVSTSAGPPPLMLPAPYLVLVLRNSLLVLVWADIAVLSQSVGLKRSKLSGPENNK